MKRFLLIPVLLLLFASNGWCLYLSDSTDVGAEDWFYAAGPQQGNEFAETAWANTILNPLGINVELQTKDPTTPIEYVYSNDNTTGLVPSVYAFEFDVPPVAPDYFIVKNSTTVALYRNDPSRDWGVFSAPSSLNIGDLEISHLTRLNGTSVPEPAAMLLLGTGFLGIAVLGRKRLLKK